MARTKIRDGKIYLTGMQNCPQKFLFVLTSVEKDLRPNNVRPKLITTDKFVVLTMQNYYIHLVQSKSRIRSKRKVWSLIMTKGDLTHTRLGSNAVAISEQHTSTALLITKTSGYSVTVSDSTY
jgi:hypothetical protein